MATRELYICVDAEVDGHVPGPYSMVSIGACAAAVRGEDGLVEILDPDERTLVWQFTHYYLHQYAGASPFGQSAHYDIKTAYAALAGTAVRDVIRRRMPSALLGPRSSKPGHALEDAKGFADLLSGLLTWQRKSA